MEIAIIDDDITYAKIIKEKIGPYFSKTDTIFVFQTFDIHYFIAHTIELVFLDIDMGAINGIDVAKKLRQLPNCPLIVFVSNIEALIHNSLEVQPLYFIRKSHLDLDIKSAISLLQ